MAFSPAAFYTVAEELRHKAAADGAHLRTLISRAYYGALIVARDAKRVNTKGPGGHERVIQAYMENAHDECVADRLKTLRELREKADYQPNTPLTNAQALMALSCSKNILQTLKALPTTQAAPQRPSA